MPPRPPQATRRPRPPRADDGAPESTIDGGAAPHDNPEFRDFCVALETAGAQPMMIRFGLREGGAAAAQVLGQLAGITPPAEIADDWNAVMAGGGRAVDAIDDPLLDAINNVSEFVLHNCPDTVVPLERWSWELARSA
jgi:hypothetical protein